MIVVVMVVSDFGIEYYERRETFSSTLWCFFIFNIVCITILVLFSDSLRY